MSNLSPHQQTMETSNSLAGSKNVAFSTITLNLKELSPNFPSLTNSPQRESNSSRDSRSSGFYTSFSSKTAQSFSSTSNYNSFKGYDRSPTRHDRQHNPFEAPSSCKELTTESKEVPLMNILKNLHKERIKKNPQDDYQPHTFANLPVNEMKLSFLGNFPKQT